MRIAQDQETMLYQGECPKADCGSSDAFTVYSRPDGSHTAYCYSCDSYFDHTYMETYLNEETPTKVKGTSAVGRSSPPESHASSGLFKKASMDVEQALTHPVRELKERRISFSTAERFGVRVGVDTRDGITPTYYLFPKHKNNEITGFIKKDLIDHSYLSLGDCKGCAPFGLNLIPQKGKKLFITEGHEDCMSVYQVLKEQSSFDWEPAVIALGGAKTRVKVLKEYMEVLDAYKEIILVLDTDPVGKESALEIAKLFSGKSYIVTLPLKDPSEMLMAGKDEQLKWAVLTGARKYQPDGIVNASECWERYKKNRDIEYYPYPESMADLNDKIYGAKAGTVTTIGAGTSIGKTTFMRELKHHFLVSTKHKIADIELEADVSETLQSLVGLELKKRITLPDVEEDEEKEHAAFKRLFDDNRYTLYDYFGGMDDDNLFSKLRYLAASGHKFIFLDHLSIIVSEYAAEGGERERIDTIMTKLAKFAKETNTCVFLVVHLKKSENSQVSFEQGAIPDLDDLRGSSTIKQLSWDVIFLSRNTQHPDPICARTTELTSAKCRLSGRTGNAGYLLFDEDSGRMVQTSRPTNYSFKRSSKQNKRDYGSEEQSPF
jgi:twinkle protein